MSDMPSHPETPSDADADSGVTLRSGRDDDREQSDAELADALDQLSRVTVGTQDLQASLEWIARLSVLAVPAAEGTGVAMLEGGHPETVFVSDPFVRAVDDMQYSLGEGPCITAAREVRTVFSGSLGADRAWPRSGRGPATSACTACCRCPW